MASGIVLSKRLLSPGIVAITTPTQARTLIEYEAGTSIEIRSGEAVAAVVPPPPPPPVAPPSAPMARAVMPGRAPVVATNPNAVTRAVSLDEAIRMHNATTPPARAVAQPLDEATLKSVNARAIALRAASPTGPLLATAIEALALLGGRLRATADPSYAAEHPEHATGPAATIADAAIELAALACRIAEEPESDETFSTHDEPTAAEGVNADGAP